VKGESEIWTQNGGDLHAAARDLDARAEAGALLKLYVTASSGRVSDADPEKLRVAWDFVLSELPCDVVARRSSWNLIEVLIPGAESSLIGRLRNLLPLLLSQKEFAGAIPQAVLIRLFSGEIERTFGCDPDYDLRPLSGAYLAWVSPYAQDDWKESQRYPTTTICWQEGQVE